jgi:hypothetical protein
MANSLSLSILRNRDLAHWITKLAEMAGLLNKGSAGMPAVPSDVSDVQPISSNSLNVTRVGGVTSLITAAGGAAMVLFNVNKAKDRAPVVVAAYLSVGVIVAAALLTVAVIIAADIRARTTIATTVSPNAGPGRADVRHIEATAAPGQAISVFSLDRAYDYVLVDATAASVALTLPSASSAGWQQMTIKRQDDTANRSVTIQPQGQETIGADHERVVARANPLQIYSNAQAWLVLSGA